MKTAVLALAMVLAASRGRADPVEPWAVGVSADAQARATELYKAGNAQYEAKNTTAAIARFRAALAVWDNPRIHFNLAVALIDTDQFLDAAMEIDRALRYGEAPFPPEKYEDLLRYKKLIAERVGTIAARCDQAGVHVLLDGRAWFDCPGTREQRVLAGPHGVVGEGDQLLTSSQQVFAVGGQATPVRIHLVSLESAVVLEYPRPRWIGWTTLGAGVALAAGGLAEWLAGTSQMDTFRRDLGQSCPSGCNLALPMWAPLAAERDSAERKGTIGIAMAAAGGAVAITGAVLAIVNRPRRVLPGGPTLEVAPGRGGAVASASWHF